MLWKDAKVKKVLTVSIAAYNIEKYIEQCVSSFITPNTVEAIEVIIVNDGSNDNTLELARKYANKYPNIFKVIDKRNGGWGSTVNAALEIATGKYFKLLDGDDYYDNKNLQEFLEVLESASADVVMSPYDTFEDETGKFLNHIEIEKCEPRKIYNVSEIDDRMLIAMHACAFNTDKLKNCRFKITENCFYTDLEYTLVALNNCETMQYYEKTIYMYRLGRSGQSVSMESLIKHWNDHYTVLSKLLDFETCGLKEQNKKYFRNRLLEMVGIQYSIFLSMKLDKGKRQSFIRFDLRIKNEFPWYDKFNSNKLVLIRKLDYKFINILYYLSKLKRVVLNG